MRASDAANLGRGAVTTRSRPPQRAPCAAHRTHRSRVLVQAVAAPTEVAAPARTKFQPPPPWLLRLVLARQPPWAFVADGSVLSIDLGGALPEVVASSPFSGPPPLSLPALRDALRKAAVDPRIVGVHFTVTPLSAGWAKLQEAKALIKSFRSCGKFTVAYAEVMSEREMYLASACEELYVPEGAYISLRGLAVSGTFLRGVLEKAGVEPQIKRIGKYKSAGDQLGRTSMSDAQREVLSSLLSQIYEEFTTGLASNRNKPVADVEALLSAPAPALTPIQLAAAGWLSGTMYADELASLLAARTGGAPSEVRSVDMARYARTRSTSLGLDVGPPSIAVIRASGAISRGRAGPAAGAVGIRSDDFLDCLARVKKDSRIKALLLRIDSGGGDALASDLMWRQLKQLGKPVIASQVDLAASGGYFMAMACDHIMAQPLTLTGSIGVITGKFNLANLYERIGFTKTTLSKGRYAEVDTDARSFTPDEEAFFDAGAVSAYTSFRNKAASSRGISVDDMEDRAQGRVWTGAQALSNGLVDSIGGFDDALVVAKKAAGLKPDDPVSLVDFSKPSGGLRSLLSGASAEVGALLAAARAAYQLLAASRAAVGAAVGGSSASPLLTQPQAAMDPITVGGYDTGSDDHLMAALRAMVGASEAV